MAESIVIAAADEVKPAEGQTMLLSDFQKAFTEVGELFNNIRPLFTSEDTEVKALGMALVHEILVYIKDSTKFVLACNKPLHERIEVSKALNNPDFTLPPPITEEGIDSVTITFDVLIKWSQRPFQLIEASRYFKGQGNKKLAERIFSHTKIAFGKQGQVSGIMVKAELEPDELHKVDTMIKSMQQEAQMAQLRKMREMAAAKKKPEAAPEPTKSKIIIDV